MRLHECQPTILAVRFPEQKDYSLPDQQRAYREKRERN